MPHLVWTNNAKFGIEPPHEPTNAPWSFGALPMCTDTAGAVTINSLTPLGGDGRIKFVAVATHPIKGTFGAAQKPLTAVGFPSTAVVDVTCAKANRSGYYEMGATFQGPGWFTSLRVNYTSHGQHLHLIVPWTVKICGPGKADTFCSSSPIA